ncbi:unnamed protein product [Owenia fusiformis]|uniref:Uncharacterized protein n=1 Tax=Owenia fusiformis TaxID=6347 RepID=A0A8J1XIQ7_OWEFU|nr:unnamed protein product [Owenia fusiformis]
MATSSDTEPRPSRIRSRRVSYLGLLEEVTRNTVKLSQEQKQRLDAYVAAGYDVAKLQFSDADVKNQKDHVEHIVKTLVHELGEHFPALKVRKQLGTGSFYNNTRILSPDEFDYLLILCLTSQVEKEETGNDSVKIKVIDESLRKYMKKYLSTYSDNLSGPLLTDDNFLQSEQFVGVLINTIHECLEQLQKKGVISYKGKHVFEHSIDTLKAQDTMLEYNMLKYAKPEYQPDDESYIPELSLHDVILDELPHGAAVRLRVQGPLGPADIDLGFCIESSTTGAGRYISIPLGMGNEWVPSFYQNLSHPKLNEHHGKILTFLKYLLRECKLVSNYTFNSHNLKTCVVIHQKVCEQKQYDKDRSLGGCLIDIAFYMFEKRGKIWKTFDELLIPYKEECTLPNINFPGETVTAWIPWQPLC